MCSRVHHAMDSLELFALSREKTMLIYVVRIKLQPVNGRKVPCIGHGVWMSTQGLRLALMRRQRASISDMSFGGACTGGLFSLVALAPDAPSFFNSASVGSAFCNM